MRAHAHACVSYRSNSRSGHPALHNNNRLPSEHMRRTNGTFNRQLMIRLCIAMAPGPGGRAGERTTAFGRRSSRRRRTSCPLRIQYGNTCSYELLVGRLIGQPLGCCQPSGAQRPSPATPFHHHMAWHAWAAAQSGQLSPPLVPINCSHRYTSSCRRRPRLCPYYLRTAKQQYVPTPSRPFDSRLPHPHPFLPVFGLSARR